MSHHIKRQSIRVSFSVRNSNGRTAFYDEQPITNKNLFGGYLDTSEHSNHFYVIFSLVIYHFSLPRIFVVSMCGERLAAGELFYQFVFLPIHSRYDFCSPINLNGVWNHFIGGPLYSYEVRVRMRTFFRSEMIFIILEIPINRFNIVRNVPFKSRWALKRVRWCDERKRKREGERLVWR